MKSLNGWQRLWVLISCLYAVVAITLIIDAKPVPPEYVLYKPADAGWRSRVVEIDSATGKPFQTRDVRMPDDTLIKGVPVNKDESAIIARYQKRMLEEKRQFFIKITLLTLLPPLFFSIFGWSLGWVYRGFKRKAHDD